MAGEELMNLEDLFRNQIQVMHHVENRLIESLPRIAAMVSSKDLKEGMEQHVQETIGHRDKLATICEHMNIATGTVECPGIEGLINEAEELKPTRIERDVQDAAVIAAVQRIEHYEIASYGTLCNYAKILGMDDEYQRLKEILDQEKATDEKLSTLAKEAINKKAAGTSEPSNFFGRHG